MIKTRTKGCVIRYLVLVIAAFLLSFGMVKISHALTEEELDFYAQNNILFYDPGASNNLCKGASYNNQVTWTDLNPLMSDGYEATGERFKLIVETYGPFAMELQRYYGIPWEMPFVMMIFESEVGYRSSGPNAENKEVGDYNMMGLMYSSALGDDYYDDSLRAPKADQTEATSYYQSISRMLLGWTLYHVRSGHGEGYKQGLEKLDKDSYDDNLLEALGLIMQSYRASGDNYYEKLYDVMRGKDTGFDGLSEDEKTAIKHYADVLVSVIKSKGWKNSAELAKSWDIPAGGLVVTDSFYNENGWGGWDDIREDVWGAYGILGLPEEVAEKVGGSNSGCGQLIKGTCYDLSEFSENSGGCTADDFTYFWQWGGDWGSIVVGPSGCIEKDNKGNKFTPTIFTGGCGYAATAMILTNLGNKLVTPKDTFEILKRLYPANAGYQCDVGTAPWKVHNEMFDELKKTDPAFSTLRNNYHDSRMSVDVVNNVLKNGGMVLTTVGGSQIGYYKDLNMSELHHGQLTLHGHYIVIRKMIDESHWQIFTSADAPDRNANEYIYNAQDIVNAARAWYNEVYAR